MTFITIPPSSDEVENFLNRKGLLDCFEEDGELQFSFAGFDVSQYKTDNYLLNLKLETTLVPSEYERLGEEAWSEFFDSIKDLAKIIGSQVRSEFKDEPIEVRIWIKSLGGHTIVIVTEEDYPNPNFSTDSVLWGLK